jgi:hypothetical protein
MGFISIYGKDRQIFEVSVHKMKEYYLKSRMTQISFTLTANGIGHILRGNCLLQPINKEKTDVMKRRAVGRKQLLMS